MREGGCLRLTSGQRAVSVQRQSDAPIASPNPDFLDENNIFSLGVESVRGPEVGADVLSDVTDRFMNNVCSRWSHILEAPLLGAGMNRFHKQD